jgi:hypothetical protein
VIALNLDTMGASVQTLRPTTMARRMLAILLILTSLAVGCSQGGNEGSPCTAPDGGGSDECESSLSCQRPSRCTAYYCCPIPASLSSNANCNGSACMGS